MAEKADQIRDFDRKHIWHPYSSVESQVAPLPVESAQGVYIKLYTGEELIDAMSSWWCMIHGYNHPDLNRAVKEQVDTLPHVMFGGLTHKPGVDLAKKLIEIAPEGLDYTFFADSGSVSVEVAIKMAFQYWYSKGDTRRKKLLTVRNGYHGDTFGAMGVCDPVNGMHHIFSEILVKHIFAEAPEPKSDTAAYNSSISSFRKKIKEHRDEIAGVILEPVVQGAGGMRIYSPEYLREVRKLCDESGIPLIADEIATGFGRTGRLFACEHAGISPDIMCVGKAMTGGYMTMGGVLANKKIAHGISSGRHGVLMHGPTFMANPMAASVSLASIRLLLESDWEFRVETTEQILKENLLDAERLESVHDVRVIGAIGVLEMKRPVDPEILKREALNKGVWLRPFGRLLYTMPPFMRITREETERICQSMIRVAENSSA
ncbi:MAG: adenosylmethionine--8-amino-7-oxononanoate transaminase [Chitinivibrionales bacterium]